MHDTKIDSLYTYYYFKKKVSENRFTLEVLAMLAREKNFILFPLENEVLYFII